MVERIGNDEGIEFGANVGAAEPILVAQANTGIAGQPAPAPTATETRVVIELEDGAILRLPATASVDQPRENGTDLEFVQPDGSVIVVPNGAIQGLTIFIGTAEIPPLTVAALFESNGIEAAAGPAGTGAGARGSGGNFEVPVGGIGDAFALGDLLDPTELAFGANPLEDLYPANTKPSFLLGTYSFRISEEGLAAGLADFGPAGGLDMTNDSFYFINLGATDPDGDPLTFTLSAPTEGLTSNGALIVWEGVGTNHLIGKVGDATVIDITVGGKTGLLIVQLLEPIDHPNANVEDVLDLGFTVTANDGRGGTATATITIDIEDDSPEAGESQSTSVDEDGLKAGVGNSDSPGDNAGNAVTATGTLGIKWGADNGDVADTVNEDGSFAQDGSGRSVYFSEANFLAFVENYGSLTSGGLPLVFSWSANKITASVVGEGGVSSQLIFQISLSDDASGGYKFQLFGPLDHEPYGGQPSGEGEGDSEYQPGEGDSYEDDIVLNFEFTAKDADGDTVGGSFTVTVDDDMPVLVSNSEHDNVRIVDEDDIRTALSLGTSPNDGAGDGSYTGNPATNGPGPAYIRGSLGGVLNFGADGPGGFGINYSAYSTFATYGLTSNGDALSYSVTTGETWATFTATAGEGGRSVFEFRVNVTTGAYEFRLYDQLDHDAPASGSDQNFDLQNGEGVEDVFALDFGSIVRAFDGDGDYIDLIDQLLIKVRDDVPELVRGKSEIRTVDEDDIRTIGDGVLGGSTGTSPNDGNGDGSYTGNPNNIGLGAATITGSLTHLVQSGADENLSFGFTSENSIRTQLSALGLKSNGQTLSYDLQGNVLYGFANANGIGQSYDVGEDRPVFKLSLNADGSYKFELIDQLDHDISDGQNFDLLDSLWNQDVGSINFGKLILATDNDGDSVLLDGAFQIKIRDDVPELAGHGLVFGVVEEEQLPGGNEDTDALLDLDYNLGFLGQNYNVISTVASDNNLMSLKNLIVGGADENGKFTARTGIINSLVRDADGNVVKSDGANVVIKSVTTGSDAGGAFMLLTATAGNNPVFTLKVYEDGDWRFQLLNQLDHKANNLEDVLALDLAAFLKYTDFDGDIINLAGDSFLIKVIDDVPEASLKLKDGAKLILDETRANSPQDTSADPNADDEAGINSPFPNSYGQLIGYAAGGSGTLFTANPSVGADQNGSTVYSLSVSSNNDSGVDDTATGQNILLFKEGSNIVGRVGGSQGAVAFVITADANTGAVKVYQFRAVEHDNNGGTRADHDESGSPEYLDSGKITLTQTVTDEDGDKDTASVDLGKVIGFEDDGPKITKLELNDRILVSHDETPGVNSDADDIYGSLSAFNSVTNKGDDADVSGSGAIGFAKEDHLISFGTTFGTDGKASSNNTVFSLVLKGGDGQDSGLKTTEGAAIKLYLEHGIIVGRVGDANGKAAFAIAVDSDDGDISLVQYLSIQHPTGGINHDESIGFDLVGTNAIVVQLTIKDGDGDTDTKMVDISDAVRFQDDGPSIEVDRAKDGRDYVELKTALLDETTPSGNPNDNTGNNDWSLTTNLAAAVAIGQVTSSASGNGSVAGLFALDIDGGADGVQSVLKAFTFDLRDDKGNLVTNTATGVETTLKVTQVAGTALGGLDDGERTIWLYRLDDKTIIGKIHGESGTGDDYIALKIELTGTAENPQFTVTQYLPVDHPYGGSSHDEGLSLKFDDKDASLSIKLTATVTDKDGDTATDSESVKIIDNKNSIVTIEDDGPTITGVSYATLGHELIQNGGFELGHGLNGSNWALFSSVPGWNAGTAVPFEVQSGGAGGVLGTNGTVVELDGDTESNGVGNGTAVSATNASIQQIVSGTEAGQTYQLTFDYAPRTNGGDNTAGLEVYFGGVKVFPPVGQTYAANQWTTITLTVTAPTNNAVLEFRGTGVQDEYGALIDNVSVKANTFGLDDESQVGGIAGGPGDDPSGKVLVGKINFDAGTDHLKTIVVDDDLNVDAIWNDENGIGHRVDVHVEWIQDGQGGKLVGTMERGGETRPVFELVVNADGNFTLTMQAPLAHPHSDADGKNNGPQTEWEDNISLEFDYKIIDNDDDVASGSIKVSVDDDTPDFVGGIEDQAVQTLGQAVNGDLNINFGADGQYADKGLVISGYQNLPGVTEQLSSDGRTLTGWVGSTKVYELKLNSNGTYDFTQFAKVPGASVPLTEVELGQGFGPTVSRDYDGFTISAIGNGNRINGSAQGIGVNNNAIDDGEKLEILFDSQMTSVTLGINHSGNEDMEIDWVAYDQNGNVVASGTTADFDNDTTRTISPGVGFYKLVLTADDDSNHAPHPSFRLDSVSGVKATTGNIDSLDFTVTAKDGDKDAQSDNFTVTLKNNTPPAITVDTGNEGNANDSVQEAALSAGSDADSTAETVTGTITVADADGLADIVSVTIDGAGADSETHSLADLVGKTVHGAHGTLTITGVTNGVISYSYTLTSTTTDIQNAMEADVFSVSVSDGEESVSASITIEIVDDVPMAVNDTGYGVTEDGACLVSGNVLTNDVSGADTPKSFVSWSAADTADIAALNTYGTLTQNSDGSWSFALDNTRAATQALTSDSNLSYTLNYTMKDADGDTSSAALTITINGANDSATVVTAQASGADHTVYESGLNPNGSNAAADTETATGSFAVTGTDGISSVVIGGTSFTLAQLQALNGSQTISTGEGTLKLISYIGSAAGGTVNYSYTLNAKIDNGTYAGATSTGFDDSVIVTVNGIGGTTASDTIIVNIVDDVPTASDEAAQNVNEGATVGGTFDFVQGADGATVTHINGSAVGAFDDATGWSNWIDLGAGEIRVKANGQYEFKADNPTSGASIDVDGTFTVTDSDGDSSTKNFAFDVNDANVPTGGTDTANVDDDGLPEANPATVPGAASFSGTLGGSVGGDTPGVFSFAALEGTSVTVGQETADLTWAGNVLTATGPRGVLFTVTVTNPATGAYTVDLKDNVLQANGDNDNTASVDLGYEITDADVSQADGTLTINFSDDVPTANSGAALSVFETAAETSGENLLLNDAQGADGAKVTAVDFNDGAGWQDVVVGTTTSVTVDGVGTFKVNTDGSWSLVPALNASTSNQSGNFTYRITDADGDTSTATQSYTVKNANHPLKVQAISIGVVEEEHGLLGGIEDQSAARDLDTDTANSGAGANETTNVVTGNFAAAVTGGNDGTLSYAIATVPANTAVLDTSGNPVTSGGYQVYFAVNNAGDLVGYTNANGGTGGYGSGDTTVFTLTLNETTGAYTFTLQAPIDHHTSGDGVEGSLSISLAGRVTVSDAGGPVGDTAAITASVTVIDDVPVATSETVQTIEGGMETINLVIVLDRSGSMNDDPDGNGGYQTRLALAKAALINLIETGNTANVLVVPFASSATSSGWMSAEDAIEYIENLQIPSSGQNTDYDAAVSQVYSAYGTPPTADKTYVFFVSDGQPNDGDNTNGIVNTAPTDMEIQVWEKFVVDNDIDQVFAVGVGSGVNVNNLAPLAYPNGDASNPVVITQESQLFAVLTGALPGSVSGNILDNGDAFGADGEGYILSFKIGSVTYTYDPEANKISDSNGTVIAGSTLTAGTPEGGQIVFHFADAGSFDAGDFSYVSPANVAALTEQEQFTYTLVDGDGDGHSATLTVEIDPNTLPDAVNDTFTATGSITISFAQLLANDSDADGHTLLLYSVQNAVNGTVEIVGTNVIFTPNGGGSGSFTYTVVDGYGGTDTATATIEIINERPVLKLNDVLTTTGSATENFADGYSGGSGWTGNWTESGDDNSTSGGSIRIVSGELRLGDNSGNSWDSNSSTSGDYIQRVVNLEGATSALLTFDFTRSMNSSQERVLIQVSNGNGSFTTVHTITGSSAASGTVANIDLSAYASANTTIRIFVEDVLDAGEFVFIDDIKIDYVKNTTVSSTSIDAAFVEGSGAVSVAADGASITDADHTTMASAKIVLTNAKAGDVLAVGSLPSGISYTVNTSIAGQIIVILTGVSSLANYQTAIKAVTFNNTSDNPDETPRVIEVTVTDPLGGTSDPATNTISVTGTNDAPTLASGLTVIANTAGAFAVPDDAFLRYATDPDGDTFTVSGASVVSGSLTTASHSGSTVTIDDNGTANGTLNVVVTDGTASGNANVSFVQDTGGALDGTSGNDIIVAVATTPTSQISTVTFAATYNVGDKVSITIDGIVFTHTVTVATQTAEGVYDALKTAQANGNGVTLNTYLSSKGYSALSSDLTGTVMTLTGPLAAAFAVSAAVDNSADVGMTTYRIDFTPSSSFDGNDVLRVVINGVTYQSDGSNSGNNSNARFDDARGSLVSALEAAGYMVTNNNAGDNRFDVAVPTTFGAPTASQLLIGSTTTTASGTTVAVQGAATNPTDQANPIVATTQTASDGGKTLNGLAGHDYLIGSSADDSLNGGDGNDILTGGDGDDILWGGFGNDTLTGGSGEDTFRFAETGSTNADTITDFVVGQDTIDLSDLLDATAIGTANIGNFVRIQDTGANALLQVNTDGTGNDWVDVATLNGHGNVGTVIDLKIDSEDHSVLVTQQII